LLVEIAIDLLDLPIQNLQRGTDALVCNSLGLLQSLML